MTKFRKHLLIGIVALGLGAGSVAAYADKPACDGRAGAGMHHWDSAKFAERMEKRRAELHAKLKLSPAQEPAWNTFVAKTKPGTPPARPDRAELAKMTTPERMDRMLAAMRARETRMEEHVAATKDFYAVLTPEQKKIFDEQFLPKPGHHHHRGGQGQG